MNSNEEYYLIIQKIVENYIKDRNIHNFSSSIKSIVKQFGYVHINEASSHELFNCLSEKLGRVIHWDNIQICKKGAYAAYRSSEILPHTDTADAHIMGWWCKTQDKIDGASILIDTDKLISSFSNAELDILKKIKLKYKDELHRTKDQFLKFDELPLIYERWGALKLNYAPWVELIAQNNIEEEVIYKFNKELENICKYNSIQIRLEEGHFLFIDNGRFLHSRKQITSDSHRCLKRVWIHTGIN